MGTLLITYKRKTFTFQDVRKEYEEMYLEDVHQYIRESILDECLGWEAAGEKEHKEFKKIKIKWL